MKIHFKIYQIVYLIITFVILLLLPIKYKYFIFIFLLPFFKWNKLILFILIGIFFLLIPEFKYLEILDVRDKMNIESSKIVKELSNNNLEKYLNEKDSFSYSRNICYFYYNDCEKSKQKINFMDYYTNEYLFYKGNIYHLNSFINSKREKYKFNNYLAEKDFRNKTIYIPTSPEDVVYYNIDFFKNYVFEDIIKRPEKCKLLFYGTQNKWKAYKDKLLEELLNDKLLEELLNDKFNKCIEKIEELPLIYEQEKSLNLEEDRLKLIKFLKMN